MICENVVDIAMSFFGKFLFVSSGGNYWFFFSIVKCLTRNHLNLFLQIERTRGVRL